MQELQSNRLTKVRLSILVSQAGIRTKYVIHWSIHHSHSFTSLKVYHHIYSIAYMPHIDIQIQGSLQDVCLINFSTSIALAPARLLYSSVIENMNVEIRSISHRRIQISFSRVCLSVFHWIIHRFHSFARVIINHHIYSRLALWKTTRTNNRKLKVIGSTRHRRTQIYPLSEYVSLSFTE